MNFIGEFLIVDYWVLKNKKILNYFLKSLGTWMWWARFRHGHFPLFYFLCTLYIYTPVANMFTPTIHSVVFWLWDKVIVHAVSLSRYVAVFNCFSSLYAYINTHLLYHAFLCPYSFLCRVNPYTSGVFVTTMQHPSQSPASISSSWSISSTRSVYWNAASISINIFYSILYWLKAQNEPRKLPLWCLPGNSGNIERDLIWL